MAYLYQTFSVGQVLTASEVQQTEDNARDHTHGSSGVNASMKNITCTGSLTADIFNVNSDNFIQGLLLAGAKWGTNGSAQALSAGGNNILVGSAMIDTNGAFHTTNSFSVPGGFSYARATFNGMISGGTPLISLYALIAVGSHYMTPGMVYMPNSSAIGWNASGGVPVEAHTPILPVASGGAITVQIWANSAGMTLGDCQLGVEFFK